jgi:hypothetical protein
MTVNFNDASQALSFLTQQAAHIESEVYKTKYPQIQYSTLVPVDTSAGEWANTVTYFSQDKVGKAGWFQGSANDMARADVNMTRHDHGVSMAGIGYGYDLEEINYARRVNMNLTMDKADAARLAAEQFIDSLTLVGDADKNMSGLINSALITPTTAAADGAGSATTFASKTGDQIARDINNKLSLINSASYGIELADTIALPIDQYNLLATKRMGDDGNSITVMEWLVKYNTYTAQTGQPLTVRTIRQLSDAGGSSSSRMVAYRRDPSVLKLHMPMTHRFLPVWQTGPMRFDVPGVMRTGGLEIRRPGAMAYLDGI